MISKASRISIIMMYNNAYELLHIITIITIIIIIIIITAITPTFYFVNYFLRIVVQEVKSTKKFQN